MPPWPEQRSITCDVGLREAAAASRPPSAPMFCARAWQARWTRDAALERLQAGRQPVLLGDVDDVLADVERRLRQPLRRSCPRAAISGHSNFSISAQDGVERDHVVALVDPRHAARRRHVLRAPSATSLDVALLELRHAAAGGMDDLGLDAVLGQHRARGHADVGVVVVDEAGRVEHGLALAEGRRRAVDLGRRGLRAGSSDGLGRHTSAARRVAIDAGDRLHQRARQRVGSCASPSWRGRRDGSGELAVAVGLGELPVDEADVPFLLRLRRRDSAASGAGSRGRIRAAARRGTSS